MSEMLDHIFSATRFQQLERVADDFWKYDRQHGLDHIRYFVGRFYGAQPLIESRPLNLIAQTIRAFLPKMVPSRLVHYVEPRLSGLELEGMVLKRLLEIDDEEQDIIANVIEPMIAEAWFYPMSVCYTGLRPGARVLDLSGNDIDPGEPFTLHIPFGRWACDPFAEDFRSRQWERHRYRVPITWMMESEAFSHIDPNVIASIPYWEDSQEGRDYLSRIRSDATGLGGASHALQPTVELINVLIYDRSGLYEATICPAGRGPETWLRAVKLDETPEKGPYQHLWYQGVPSMLVPAALIGFTRDIAEAGDMLMRKNIDSAMRSKKILGYGSGLEDEAKALMENPHGTMINMEDPEAAQVFDLNLMSKDLLGMVAYVTEQWNEAAQSPQMLSGGQTQDNTATKADIRNTRTGEQVQFLNNKTVRLCTAIDRNRCFWFQTDPARERVVDVLGGDGATIELAYSPKSRIGSPKDFRILCDIASSTGTSPEQVMERVMGIMDRLLPQLPLFQMGIFDLGKTLRFFQRHGAEGLDEISGDISALQERLMADQAVNSFYDQAAGGGGAMGGGGGGGAGAQTPGAPPQGAGGFANRAMLGGGGGPQGMPGQMGAARPQLGSGGPLVAPAAARRPARPVGAGQGGGARMPAGVA